VRGAFATGIAGTRIDVRLRMLPAVAVFMLFRLSFAAAFFVAMLVIAVRNPSRSWLPLIGLAFFAFGYLLMALLAVALIATGFASRVVLHKRLRAAYVPVLLLLGAIGVAAAWSLTHHPHWGIPR
jgi:hypothetical protein